MEESVLSTFLRRTDIMGEYSTLSIVLAVVLGGVLLLWVQRLYTLYSVKARPDAVLPQGSLGWPIIGETFAFAKNPQEYAHDRVKRYGKFFKSNVFLRPTVFGTSPEFAKFVNNNTTLFRRSFPKSFEKILGPKTFMLQEGPKHMSVRKVVMKSVGPEALRNQVQSFETIILENMASWARSGDVVGLNVAQKLTWDTSNWVLFGEKNPSSTPQGRKNFEDFRKIVATTTAIPVNLPITTYGIGLKAREDLIKYFKNLIQQSKGKKTSEGVFFGALLAAREDPEGREELRHLDDDTLAENMFLLNAAAYDTTSTSLCWMLKFLIDYPEVFKRCQAEHQEILKSKDPSVEGPRLTWDDTRKMVYTLKFFQEVQRTLSLVPIIFREAKEDVKYDGYLLPKGWIITPLVNFIHTDPAIWPGTNFNPDRFDVPPKPNSYIPFSTGPHMCPGIDMAKLITCIVVHHLTTTYTHERAGPDAGMEYEGILPKPVGRYPIKVSAKK